MSVRFFQDFQTYPIGSNEDQHYKIKNAHMNSTFPDNRLILSARGVANALASIDVGGSFQNEVIFST